MIVSGGKKVYKTLLWKSPYPEFQKMKPADVFRRYERVFELPADTIEVSGISLYNCTSRGRLCFDEVRLEVAGEEKAIVETPPEGSARDSGRLWSGQETHATASGGPGADLDVRRAGSLSRHRRGCSKWQTIKRSSRGSDTTSMWTTTISPRATRCGTSTFRPPVR